MEPPNKCILANISEFRQKITPAKSSLIVAPKLNKCIAISAMLKLIRVQHSSAQSMFIEEISQIFVVDPLVYIDHDQRAPVFALHST